VCHGPLAFHAMFPQQHGAVGRVGSMHRTIAVFASNDSRAATETYQIPGAALEPACTPLAYATKVRGFPQTLQCSQA
jgi:hypothetical protein